MAQIDDAVSKGATVHLGGHRIDGPGAFVEATVLSGVTPGMRAYREELFGPAAAVYRVAVDEAAELANSSAFGRRSRLLQRREAGGGGGTKRSGVGRELGPLGIDEFVNKKLIYTPPPAVERLPCSLTAWRLACQRQPTSALACPCPMPCSGFRYPRWPCARALKPRHRARRETITRRPAGEVSDPRARCIRLLAAPVFAGEASASGAGGLASQEGQQVGVELVLMGVREAVRRARIVDFRCVLDELR
jgi:hypothetical protein